ncbi:uncharacterized protein LOC130966816 [Arachis stenosperma]|uniref:uncharacterized protein LOC130966816 n=1 Tax=Arachis stenosperma TaxID=217475 RepID=UPI0025ABD761|nr:uncharacterized protein LOC130966816 [Arachis stenosperma]
MLCCLLKGYFPEPKEQGNVAGELQRTDCFVCEKHPVELCNILVYFIYPTQGVELGEGYYNRDIKTRKTSQGVELNSDQIGLQRSEQLRELYKSLKAVDASPPIKVKYYSENNKRLIHFSTCEVAFILPCRVDTFRDYKYLGTQNRVDGIVGEYKWMTFGEAGTARSAIGSGLIYYGIPKGSSNLQPFSHQNLMMLQLFAIQVVQLEPQSYISYLPLAHIYERTNQVMHVHFDETQITHLPKEVQKILRLEHGFNWGVRDAWKPHQVEWCNKVSTISF